MSLLWSLASWVQLSSCGLGLPPPPDFGPPVWGRTPGRCAVPAAAGGALPGSTAARHWTRWSGSCKNKRNRSKQKSDRIIYMMHMQSTPSLSTSAFGPSVSSVWRSLVNCFNKPRGSPCINISMWNKWTQGTAMEEIVWTDWVLLIYSPGSLVH